MKNNKIWLITLAPKTHRTAEENLGIGYLKSALIENGYSVEIIDGWLHDLSVETVYERILKEKDHTLFVGLSSYMSNTEPTIELIQKLKEMDENIKIVCGGFGPTFYPQQYLQSKADYIIRGEGEQAICELADCIVKGNEPIDIQNVGYIKNDRVVINNMRCLIDDLDVLPYPSRDTMDAVLARKSYVNMVTARGCSGNCEFCSVISFFRLSQGRVWRTRSIANIVDEIELLYKMGVTHIKMVDDSFVDGTRDEKWCSDFADEIERRNIKVKLRGQIRADKVTDTVLENLKRAGFFSFACGIENGSRTALSRMNKTATLEDNERALKLFKKYGYIVQMGFILFDKGTTFDELVENYKFMSKYDFVITKGIFSEMYSAEGTVLNNRLKTENALLEGNFLSNNQYKISDETVRKIYMALKLWHKSHSVIYDMTIDPLTAPKAISDTLVAEFYDYIMKLKKQDLEVFREVLTLVQQFPDIDMEDYIKGMILGTEGLYHNIEENVKRLYKKSGLVYKAEANPFI